MNSLQNKDDFDEALAAAFGAAPKPDFDTWRRQHADSVEALTSRQAATVQRRRAITSRITKLATAVAVLIGLGIALSYLGADREGESVFEGNPVFADVYRQIEKAKTATWTETWYYKHTSEDGQRKWISSQTYQYVYKSPGLERLAEYEDGKLDRIVIEDRVHAKKLSLDPKEKRATLYQLDRGMNKSGPFDWVTREMKGDLEWLGTKKIAGRRANGFRAVTVSYLPRGKTRTLTRDFWVDADTKRLVLIQDPATNVYDPEKDPDRKNPADERTVGSTSSAVARIWHDIIFDPELDDSLFSFEVPEDYDLETVDLRVEATEKDVIGWLHVMAEYYDRTFPDGETARLAPDVDAVNAVLKKGPKNLTWAEQKIWDDIRAGGRMPSMLVSDFIDDTAGESWMYLGKGVKLGDKDRIVCWYRPKGSKTYRVVYGDLSVKDVAPADLPLKVEE